MIRKFKRSPIEAFDFFDYDSIIYIRAMRCLRRKEPGEKNYPDDIYLKLTHEQALSLIDDLKILTHKKEG